MFMHEKAVREAAAQLHTAIVEARGAGFAVAWPVTLDALPAIAISETKKVAPATEKKQAGKAA